MEIKGEIYNFARKVKRKEMIWEKRARQIFFFLTRRGRKLFDRGRNKLFREIEIREALLFSFRSLIEVVGIGDFILKKKSFVDFTPVCFCLINSGSTNSLSLFLFVPFSLRFFDDEKSFFFPLFLFKVDGKIQ